MVEAIMRGQPAYQILSYQPTAAMSYAASRAIGARDETALAILACCRDLQI